MALKQKKRSVVPEKSTRLAGPADGLSGSGTRATMHRRNLGDPDLASRTDYDQKHSLDARLLTNSRADIRNYFADTWLLTMQQMRIILPVLAHLLRRMPAQFSTLSRISARPAALAKLASAQRIRTQPMIVRIVLVPMASVFIAVGVSAQLTAGLGIGPGDMIVSAISTQSGLTFGISALFMSGALAAVASLLGRPPRLATLANVAMIGPLIDFFRPHLEFEGGVGSQILQFSFGLWAIGIGIGCLMHARLGIGTHEAFSLAISDHTGIPVKKVRLGQELTWVFLGMALGSGLGVGTIAVAAFIAPAISAGVRSVGRVLTSFSDAMEAPEVAAHVDFVSF